MKLTIEDVRSRFIKHFDGSTGNVYAAPGRINLIGEHTDYNNGFVFPGAVEQGMIAEIKPNGTRNVDAYSIDLKDIALTLRTVYSSHLMILRDLRQLGHATSSAFAVR